MIPIITTFESTTFEDQIQKFMKYTAPDTTKLIPLSALKIFLLVTLKIVSMDVFQNSSVLLAVSMDDRSSLSKLV